MVMAIVTIRNGKKQQQQQKQIDVSIGKIKMGKTKRKKNDEQWKNQMRTNNSLFSVKSFHFRVALLMTMNETIE